MGNIRKLHNELQNKEVSYMVPGCISEAAVIYGQGRNFISSLLTSYPDKHRAAYLEDTRMSAASFWMCLLRGSTSSRRR